MKDLGLDPKTEKGHQGENWRNRYILVDSTASMFISGF